MEDDPSVSYWLLRYFDSQRMNVQRGDLDEIQALEVQAFRVIESAINDTQRRDADRRAKKQKQEGKAPAGRSGGRVLSTSRPKSSRRSGRSRR